MHRILVIDDSNAIHALVRAHLEDEPVEVHSAMDGATGRAMTRQLVPDLILLDVELPDESGFDVCRALKTDTATMGIPVVFLTGAASVDEKVKGLELGACDYVTKPFDHAELKARVRTALRARELVELLEKRAEIDGLTGLWNRAYFDQRLAAEIQLHAASERPISCIMLDVDHFKGINDRYGHPFGDQVLRAVADSLRVHAGANDVVCRYGGEEFAVLALGLADEEAMTLAELLRTQVEGMSVRNGGDPVKVTCSFGVAVAPGREAASLVDRADAALYRAKKAGRNRVMSDGEDLRTAPRLAVRPRPSTRVLLVGESLPDLGSTRHALEEAGYLVHTARSGHDAMRRLRESAGCIVVAAQHVGDMSGTDLCRTIRAEDFGGWVHVILNLSGASPEERTAALAAGADDFLSPNATHAELLARLRAGERVLALDTREATIFVMAKLAETRDPASGFHLERIRAYCRTLAQYLSRQPRFASEVNAEFVRLIALASPLHDVGHMGIPESVLLKPGRLNERELEIMKSHTLIGAQTLDSALALFPASSFLRMARDVAATHHERWDGSGYPLGLCGERIPLSGRIVALADVYDALTRERIYKASLTHEVARSMITRESGTHFDPDLVQAFVACEAEFLAIRERYTEAVRQAA